MPRKSKKVHVNLSREFFIRLCDLLYEIYSEHVGAQISYSAIQKIVSGHIRSIPVVFAPDHVIRSYLIKWVRGIYETINFECFDPNGDYTWQRWYFVPHMFA
jgi:hypothetical protein